MALSVVVLSMLAAANAQLSSPEPGPTDPAPMRPSYPIFFLTTAGVAPHREQRLGAFSSTKICPSDYPQGFSIRCHVRNAKRVTFRLNGKNVEKEYKAPYYLAGDFKGRVKPFDYLNMAGKNKARISCLVATRSSVWVDLVKDC